MLQRFLHIFPSLPCFSVAHYRPKPTKGVSTCSANIERYFSGTEATEKTWNKVKQLQQLQKGKTGILGQVDNIERSSKTLDSFVDFELVGKTR